MEGGVTLSKPKLLGGQQVVPLQEYSQSVAHNLLQNFGEIWEQRDRPIVIWKEAVPTFEDGDNLCNFKLSRNGPSLQ